MEAGEPGKVGGQPSAGPGKGGSADAARRRRMLRLGIIGLAVVVAVVAWLVTRGGDSESEPAEPTSAGFEARIVDEGELAEIAAASGHPVYWAGAMDGKVMVATEDKEGNVQVMYVDENAKAAAKKKAALTIGSYPISDPTAAVDGYAERKGAIVEQAPDGRKLVSSEAVPASVYFASPDNSVQVEVYDPSPKRAMSLALSGKVQPVG